MHCWEKLPREYLEKIKKIILPEEIDAALESYCKPKKLSIRINQLLTSVEKVIEELQNFNIQFETIPWYRNALLLKDIQKEQITNLELYKTGQIYLQSLSSMIPALILDPKENETILDITAAPGSKTTQIAQMMHNTGQIIANDISRARLYKLQAVLKDQQVKNVKVLLSQGEHIWRKYPNFFDKTLVDVPCTMEGRFNPEDSKTFEDWTPKKCEKLSSLQKKLLRSAFFATKPEGTIVYATCTLSPEENEEVVDWLYNQENKNMLIETISLPNISLNESLPSWKGREFSAGIKNTRRVYPSETMEGFYIAKIKRML